MESLAEIALRVAQCSDCSLHLSRTKPVPGEGDNSAEIMLIGEGPGALQLGGAITDQQWLFQCR